MSHRDCSHLFLGGRVYHDSLENLSFGEGGPLRTYTWSEINEITPRNVQGKNQPSYSFIVLVEPRWWFQMFTWGDDPIWPLVDLLHQRELRNQYLQRSENDKKQHSLTPPVKQDIQVVYRIPNILQDILLMEEILHHLTCMKPRR